MIKNKLLALELCKTKFGDNIGCVVIQAVRENFDGYVPCSMQSPKTTGVSQQLGLGV
jgi:hypothetical protein